MDNDTISRQAAIDAYGDWHVEEGTAEGFIGTVKQLLKGLPSAQPEIIRCKDCKYGSPNGRYGCRVYHYKRYETHDMKPDDYCSKAERRTDE